MAAVYVIAAALSFAVWSLALASLFWTERVQRWQARLFRRFPGLWWPLPPEWIEGYFQSRYSYYLTKFVGLVVLLWATVMAVASISQLR